MAFTETYASVAGSGAHDGSSQANEWTMAEAFANATAAGTRVNCRTGSYSQGAVSIVGGTASAIIAYRGYNATPGDLDNLGFNSDGSLNVTNFPTVTVTGIIVPAALTMLHNFSFSGALSSTLIGGAANDRWQMLRCKVVNTQNNASARTVLGDDFLSLIGCEFSCTGAAHASVVDADASGFVYGCRFTGVSSSSLLSINTAVIQRSAFYGSSGAVGVQFFSAATGEHGVIYNTFYDLDTAITFPNSAPAGVPLLFGNHVTDCGKWLDNLYSATGNITVIEAHNRLRDITTPRTGIETVTFGEVTTDTGGHATDYEDAPGGDFHLISGAPGRASGLVPNTDIGAYQHVDAGGGGSGGGRRPRLVTVC